MLTSVLVGCLTLFVISATGFALYSLVSDNTKNSESTKSNDDKNDDDTQTVPDSEVGDVLTMESEAFTLTYQYMGSNQWDYNVIGYLPTPCYTFVIDVTVAESFPEQVTVRGTKSDGDTEMCATVIKDVNETGSFSASKDATVRFEVVEE